MPTSISERRICSPRHSSALDNFLRRLVQPPKKILRPYLHRGDTAIDLGCGPGFFIIAMSELAGSSGTVIAVDVQQEMLDRVRDKLTNLRDKAGLAKLVLHQCGKNEIGLDGSIKADFVLAYYMVHETPDQFLLFRQIRQLLKPTGSCLIVEPPFHVGKKEFARTLSWAEQAGLTVSDRPKNKGGKSALLKVLP